MSLFWQFLLCAGCGAFSVCGAMYIWWYLSKERHRTKDIIANVNETVAIFDRHDKPFYVNVAVGRSRTDEILRKITHIREDSGIIPKDFRTRCLTEDGDCYYDGVVKLYEQDESVYSWKMRAILQDKKYFGHIFVFNDITQYSRLHEQLDYQNAQLREALDAQRKYTEVVKRIGMEEERERIMSMINAIAKGYLEQLNESIGQMEAYVADGEAKNIAAFEEENDKMIQVTRDTLARIRSTVKQLHLENGA